MEKEKSNETTSYKACLPVGCITNDGKLVTKRGFPPTREPLTTDEENLIKDILNALGNNRALEKQVQKIIKMQNSDYYNCLADSIFWKLQNGRLIVAGE